MSAWRRTAALALVALCWATVPAPASVVAEAADQGDGASETLLPDGAPAEQSRQMRHELRDLARAWADGGGTYGYPFWEKAGQRWRTDQITSTMYREYVTGYRDRLVPGCDLVGSVDTTTDVADRVQRELERACSRRLDGLREQQRWLDGLIERDSGAPDADVEELTASIAEHEVAAEEALQESWRSTRIVMNDAQEALQQAGFEPLPEDAFV